LSAAARVCYRFLLFFCPGARPGRPGRSPVRGAPIVPLKETWMSRVIKKRRKKMRKHKHRKLLKKTRHQRRSR